mmetsp:Transcript_21694/g.45270  ORF Transcript_21694/g.45270 Transcript_21694/m.45270 type:complete len:758 (-) Transcript_21694:32-2305(-)
MVKPPSTPRSAPYSHAFSSPSSLFQRFSRSAPSKVQTSDIPYMPLSSSLTPLGILFFVVNAVVPVCYSYVAMYSLRVLLDRAGLLSLLPEGGYARASFEAFEVMPWPVNAWAVVEVAFYVFQKAKISYFQKLDTLAMSLNAAPMMTEEERDALFNKIVDAESDDPVSFIRGWFFDAELADIQRYDVMDFLCWSLFDGRNQEHLTEAEAGSLAAYLERMEEGVGKHLGSNFSFSNASPPLPPAYYSNFVRQLVAGVKRQRERLFAFEAKEEVHKVGKIYNETYYKLVGKGGALDRNLGKVRSLAQTNFDSATESLHSLNVRFNTAKERAKARFIAHRATALRRKLAAYQTLLGNMRKYSNAVTPDQMAHVMSEITVVHHQMMDLEARARAEYSSSLSLIAEYLKGSSQPEPLRYAKYSGDPLFDICTYPIFMHAAMLAVTEGGLRLLMYRRGFERRKVGGVSYYVKIGLGAIAEVPDPGDEDDATGRCSSFSNEATPIVFVHGIGIGLIAYLGLVDKLAATNRTVFLPEVSCVTGFRAWMGPSSVKSPAMVASTLTAMLGSHGYMKATFVGHSYGTSWLSFMAKWAPEAVDSLVFLDPICFSLHTSHLTRKFVYQRADPGNVAYLIRTDLMVHFTLQRAFPWSRVALFQEELPCKTAVFLSEKDCLVPSGAVWEYLKKKGGVMSKSDGHGEVSDGGNDDGDEEEEGVLEGLEKTQKDKLFCCEWLGYDHGDFLIGESSGETQDAIVRMVQKLSCEEGI